MVFLYFAVVALDQSWLHAEVLDAWRPVLLPLSLAVAAIASNVVGRPCTLQYARRLVGPEWWHNHHFILVNRILMVVWACAFLAVAAITAVARPSTLGERIAATGLGLGPPPCAAWFSRRFPRCGTG